MGFKVTVVGLGLMGGSLAKALRGWRGASIVGVEKDKRVAEKALAEGTVDGYYLVDEMDPAQALAGDVIIIAVHPLAALNFLENYGKYAKAASVWTDIVGVKKAVLDFAAKFVAEGVDFIGGHPMAGLEKFGYDYSTADLFQGCNYVMVRPEGVRDESFELIKEMAFYIGASRVTLSDALCHDMMIAYVSQMPHVLAPAIVANDSYFASKGFEGSSFHDLTRVGTLDPRLWSELFMLNKEPLSRVLKELEEAFARLRKMIETEDRQALAEALARGADRKDEWLRRIPTATILEKS